MVGPPKTLMDLRKVEGAVRLTCRTCGHVAMIDREEMILDRRFQRKSLDWVAILNDQMCRSPKCDSRDIKVDGVPFGESAAELRERRAMMLVVNVALMVLTEGARKPSDTSKAAIRLALRVLHPHLRDQELATQYWKEAVEEHGQVGAHPHLVVRWMVNALVAKGYSVWAELR